MGIIYIYSIHRPVNKIYFIVMNADNFIIYADTLVCAFPLFSLHRPHRSLQNQHSNQNAPPAAYSSGISGFGRSPNKHFENRPPAWFQKSHPGTRMHCLPPRFPLVASKIGNIDYLIALFQYLLIM